MGPLGNLCVVGGNYMSGSLIWYLQRISAVLLLGYFFWLSLVVFGMPEFTYFAWIQVTSSLVFKLLSTIVVGLIIIHAFIGLWTIGTDYLTQRTLGFLHQSAGELADLFSKAYSILFLTLGLIYLLFALYIIWN